MAGETNNNHLNRVKYIYDSSCLHVNNLMYPAGHPINIQQFSINIKIVFGFFHKL